VDTRAEQGFIRVNISNSRNGFLVQKHRFHRPRGIIYLFYPNIFRHVPWFGPKPRFHQPFRPGTALGNVFRPPKTAYVSKSQVQTSIHEKPEVNMVRQRGARRLNCQLTSHSQVDKQSTAGVETDGNPFCQPSHSPDIPAFDFPVPGRIPRMPQTLVAMLDISHPPPRQGRPEVAHHGFDFR
jgi:hypothetical protein